MHNQKLLLYSFRIVIFTGILGLLDYPDNGIRMLLLYVPTLWLACIHEFPDSLSFWVALYGLVHLAFPFEYGTFDVFMHHAMLVCSFYRFGGFPARQEELWYVRRLQFFLFVGSVFNVIISMFWSVQALPLLFHTVPTGCWLVTHLMYTDTYDKYYLPMSAFVLALFVAIEVLLRANPSFDRYSETLLIVPTWILANVRTK